MVRRAERCGRPRRWARVGLPLVVSAIVLSALGPGRAEASTVIVEPSTSPFTLPLGGAGEVAPFDIVAAGFAPHQLVLVEICDGKPSGAPGWDPSVDCDNTTSPAPAAASATGEVNFPAGSENFSITDFAGASPNGQFNCIRAGDAPADAHQVDETAGLSSYSYEELSSQDARTPSGLPLNPGTPAWTNCQLRVSTNDSYATGDQQFLTLAIPAGARVQSSSSGAPGRAGTAGTGSTGGAGGGQNPGDTATGSGSGATGPGPPSRPAPPRHLAYTGMDITGTVRVASWLIAAGVVLTVAARCRRASYPTRARMEE